MKIKHTILLISFLLSFAMQSVLSAPPSTQKMIDKSKPQVQLTDPNKVILVTKKNPNITLKIKSNPTTGFIWFLADNGYNSQLMKPVSRTFKPPTSGLIGASGYEVWKFKVDANAFKVPQLTGITLQYIRPWVVSNNGRKLTFTVAIYPEFNSPNK